MCGSGGTPAALSSTENTTLPALLTGGASTVGRHLYVRAVRQVPCLRHLCSEHHGSSHSPQQNTHCLKVQESSHTASHAATLPLECESSTSLRALADSARPCLLPILMTLCSAERSRVHQAWREKPAGIVGTSNKY